MSKFKFIGDRGDRAPFQGGIQPDSLPAVCQSVRYLWKRNADGRAVKPPTENWSIDPQQMPKAWRTKLPNRVAVHTRDFGALPEPIPTLVGRQMKPKSVRMLSASSTRQPNDCPKDNSLFARTERRRIALA